MISESDLEEIERDPGAYVNWSRIPELTEEIRFHRRAGCEKHEPKGSLMIKFIILVLVTIGMGVVSYLVSKETRRQECANCQQWMDENPGLWFRDPCKELCDP